jgi:putative NIF3 family GTP cyclohydrolase 1 type 2
VGADSGSGSDAKADTGTEADSSSDAKAETGSVADSGSDAKADAAADSGTTAGLCNYASGLNVAWVNFANDVPNPDIATFTTIFKNTYAAGGRVIRWWFHTNGTVTPGYQSNGMAQDLPASHVAGVKAILAAAAAQGVAINISLWSFDMLQGSSETISATTTTNNMNLLQVDANRQAYITNYLTPLVTQLKGTPGLYSYEIFNEPEGMTATGWAAYRTTEAYIQTTVNQFAAAIHAADPKTPVTNGSQEFQYCSGVAGMNNYYSDSALAAAGGMATGTLDFYEVHYYESNGIQYSCFQHPASYWKLDKKLVMGEFFAATTDGVSQDDTYTYLYSNGYNGSWAWSYESDMPWPSMQVPMQDLYNAETATVGSCP